MGKTIKDLDACRSSEAGNSGFETFDFELYIEHSNENANKSQNSRKWSEIEM